MKTAKNMAERIEYEAAVGARELMDGKCIRMLPKETPDLGLLPTPTRAETTAQELQQLGGKLRRFVQQFEYLCHITRRCHRLLYRLLYGFKDRLLLLIEHLFKLVSVQASVLVKNVRVHIRHHL